jgi:hypothetical protein
MIDSAALRENLSEAAFDALPSWFETARAFL